MVEGNARAFAGDLTKVLLAWAHSLTADQTGLTTSLDIKTSVKTIVKSQTAARAGLTARRRSDHRHTIGLTARCQNLLQADGQTTTTMLV